jgi:hypothetical protein
VVFVYTARQVEIPSNFYRSLSAPPPRLCYFTKKRFIGALTRARSGEYKPDRPYLQGNFGGGGSAEAKPQSLPQARPAGCTQGLDASWKHN